MKRPLNQRIGIAIAFLSLGIAAAGAMFLWLSLAVGMPR